MNESRRPDGDERLFVCEEQKKKGWISLQKEREREQTSCCDERPPR